MYFKRDSLTELSIALRNNTLSLPDYISETLNRLDLVDKEIIAFLPEKGRKKRLLAEADALIEKYPTPSGRPPLFGVLVGIKDLFNVDGLPTRAGSDLPAKAFTGREAAAVTRLKEAGALILGKTRTTEFAYFKPAATRNPINPDYTPGGSSSGSAAAVAAGFCPLALGTQTIASIIRPAAYCGIVGFKPTFGRIETDGVFPFAPSADHVGFFTQDIPGAALAAGVLVKDWDMSYRITSKPRIFLPADAFLVQANCNAFNRFYEKVDLLTERGYEVIPYPLFKDIKEVNRVHQLLISAEFAKSHKQLYADYGELYSEPSRTLYEQGIKVTKTELQQARYFQQEYRQNLINLMKNEGVDVWISPAATSSAPKGLESTGNPLMSLPWTFTGLPSITMPVSRSAHNMPLGLQITAGFGRDERLIQYTGELHQVFSY